MKIMSAKQYEKILDEQFEIAGISVIVALFPSGWMAIDETNDLQICIGKIDKKKAIEEVEKYTGAKYDPKKTKFL
jgi:hypothetical protein